MFRRLLGRFLAWMVALLLRRVRLDDRWVAQVREACGRGRPVFVLRHLSLVDFVVLDHLVRRAGLPPIGFVYGLESWFYRPFRWFFRAWMRMPKGVSDERHLAGLIRRGVPVCVFLRCRPRRFQLRSLRPGPRPLAVCVALARRGVPVVAIPQLVVWGRRPPTAEPGIVSRVLGPSEWPGMFRAVVQAVKGRGALVVRQIEPVDVREWASRRTATSAVRLGRALDAALSGALERGRRAAVGPEVKGHARTATEMFASARFRRDIEGVAERRGVPVEHLMVEARRILRQTAARFRIEAVEFLAIVFSRLWNRMYDGIEVDRESLDAVADAARRGPVILLPNHKSHIDYILLSQVFYDEHLAVPFIAAGRNLAFWPLGAIFRRAGAFFVRRRFEGDDLYVAVLRAYCRKLLLDGCHIEVFFEGTRSRTGKLLPPRIGLLGMLAEAGLTVRGRPIHVVPAAITYERVIEERAHVRETSGAEKAPEDLRGLLGARRVLRSRFGRLHVRFGEPIDLRAWAREHGLTAASAADRNLWRPAVMRLAYAAAHAINRRTLGTPTALVATALLGGARGMRTADLQAEVARLRDRLLLLGAPLAASLDPSPAGGGPLPEAVRRAVELFASDGTVQVSGPRDDELVVVDDRMRPRLDYYRNTVLPFFVEPALVALGLLRSRDRAGLPDRVNDLARMWKYEFIYAAAEDAPPGTWRGLAFLDRIGATAPGVGDDVRIASHAGLRSVARLLLAFLESYAVVLCVLERAPGRRRQSEIVARCLAEAERLFLRGVVSCYEARNRVTLANALRAFRDMGLVEFPSPDDVRVPDDVLRSERLIDRRLSIERLIAAMQQTPADRS